MQIINRFTKKGLANVRYSITGQPSEDLIVLMHGLTTPKEVFDDLTRSLIENQFQVLAFDFYGGKISNSNQPAVSKETYVSQSIELIKKFLPYNAKRNVHLLGHSVAGPMIAMTAIKMRNVVNSLTLLSATGPPYVPSASVLIKMLETSNGGIKGLIENLLLDDLEFITNRSIKNKLTKVLHRGIRSRKNLEPLTNHLKYT